MHHPNPSVQVHAFNLFSVCLGVWPSLSMDLQQSLVLLITDALLAAHDAVRCAATALLHQLCILHKKAGLPLPFASPWLVWTLELLLSSVFSGNTQVKSVEVGTSESDEPTQVQTELPLAIALVIAVSAVHHPQWCAEQAPPRDLQRILAGSRTPNNSWTQLIVIALRHLNAHLLDSLRHLLPAGFEEYASLQCVHFRFWALGEKKIIWFSNITYWMRSFLLLQIAPS
eukprot:TRINITY_DN80031_c0_g1_i1.p1 TRINITY_DN80031_c0_g1~~TRINITY_DN80031_c0_g1_i1.p1  ORF type:complete len:228 (+),score=42.13 TRINITY_DN80031_c0_g1_i1:73-756(+)